MVQRHFSLIDDPWIKVIDDQNVEKTVSLKTLFEHAGDYRQLAGEMKSQDLAILRFLLAILNTVYSRFNADNEPYDWLTLDDTTLKVDSIDEDIEPDEINEDLLTTWHKLYQNGHFSKIVEDYLSLYSRHFDLFDEDVPFYQVTKSQYDSFVPEEKSIEHGKGTVAIKQLDRTISESNNTPDIFSPRTNQTKNKISLDALVRWLITYQNYSAVTDKTKVISKENFTNSKGWLYELNPVYVIGNSLFETLMLNMILVNGQEQDIESYIQAPVWEQTVNEYVDERLSQILPNNITELYTLWSRLIHIEWVGDSPVIFSAMLPKVNNDSAFVEPMTTWKFDKKHKKTKPDIRRINSLSKAMWRNFGQYVSISGDDVSKEPGVVKWLDLLKSIKLIPGNYLIHLATAGLISDGKPSQAPIAEFFDDMQINADVLFDKDPIKKNYWPKRIDDMVVLTNKMGGVLNYFAHDVAKFRGIADPNSFADRVTSQYYDKLNMPFREWLSGLSNDDERDEKENIWKSQAYHLAKEVGTNQFKRASMKEIRGKSNQDKEGKKVSNIFISFKQFIVLLFHIMNYSNKGGR